MEDFDEDDSGCVWDEYKWERFLQQQDQKTEKYMELLERYLDHPQRDQIIANEMGWSQVIDEEDWSEEVDAMLDEEDGEDDYGVSANDDEEDDDEPIESVPVLAPASFEEHRLYRAAFALTVWIDQLFDVTPALQSEPAAVKLATHSALTSAKLAAALSDEEGEELGMTIAYLKRALKAITTAMDAAAYLANERLISPRQYAAVKQRLFEVRDGIISMMGEYRGEWLRRFGSL